MPKALVDSLKRFSQNRKVTLYTTLLAVFNVMIYLDTSREDILVGCPIANRSRSETEGLIGFFVNTLVMRNDLSGDPAFIDLVDRVREVALGAYSHQDLPFEKLVKALQPERNLSHTPLIQVVFNFNNTPDSSVRLSGLSLTPFDAEFTSVKFDLAMHVISTEKDLTVFVESSADLFTEATTRLILWRFRKLLEIALDRPTARLTELKKELGEADKEMWVAKERELKELRNLKFRGAKRKAVGRSHMRDQEEK
jgi:non-ribosomal peptide synthetase component F